MDLGPCPKSHSPRLQEEYKAAIANGQRFPEIEAEFRKNITIFMTDVDRKIAANRRRLDVTPEETQKLAGLTVEIKELDEAHTASMAEVERLGESGQVEESLAELAKADALKEEKAERQAELQKMQASAGSSGHQKLQVCDVCGAYLSILDSDRRLADHFTGKMHMGYFKLRELISEFKTNPLPEPASRSAPTGPASIERTRSYDRSSRGPPEPPLYASRDRPDRAERAERGWGGDRAYAAPPRYASRPPPDVEQPLHYGGSDDRDYLRDRRGPRARDSREPRSDHRLDRSDYLGSGSSYRRRSRSPGYEPRRRPLNYD